MKKVAVVVGAFGGIGYATLKALDDADYAVVAISRSADSEENRKKLSALAGFHKLAITCDITSTEDLNRALDIIRAEYSGIDVLVNSAGASTPVAHKDLAALTDELFDSVVATNLRGVYSTIRTFAPIMNQGSVIVNVTSTAGLRLGGSNIAYAAAKAGVENMTRNLSKALAPRTRTLNVAPGACDSGFAPGANYQLAINQTPMGRLATVNDIAGVIMNAIASPILNGCTIVVDGGRST
jgi:3-oxoacyl-[acyl-carrier protein] reductase